VTKTPPMWRLFDSQRGRMAAQRQRPSNGESETSGALAE
jgi:hypothetical protein